ncbi:MAG: dihydrofolate reductase family protein [Deltaproteobacteria bacterium]|nr:dihydrofolate reductase family protein [Deltaproteobacteria bacterium]
MRNVIVVARVSADGFFAASDGGLDWIVEDAELDEAIGRGGALLLGRRTFELLAPPSPPAFVVSRALVAPPSRETRLLRSIEAVDELLREAGEDLVVRGSASVVRRLAQLQLIDELALAVSPVLLGSGRTLLGDVAHPTPLLLVEARPFSTGCVLLRYVRR